MKDVGQAFCEMGFAIKEERPIFVKIGMNYDVSVRLWNSHIIEEWQPIFELLLEYRALLKGWHGLIGKIIQKNQLMDTFQYPMMIIKIFILEDMIILKSFR